MAADPKSTIREALDQLFLDRSVGKYLSNVSSNRNFGRPVFGFSNDSLWRAVSRRMMLDTRTVVTMFCDVLREIFGPQHTEVTVALQNAAALDVKFYVSDPLNIPQHGTLILNEGLASEQTIQYDFRDPRNGTIELGTDVTLANNITAVINNAKDVLRLGEAATATTLRLENTIGFPTTGFPCTLIVNRGTTLEEIVVLTGNTTATNELTIDAPGLVNTQPGPVATVLSSRLVKIEADQSVIQINNSTSFPESGLIRVQQDEAVGTPVNTVRYFSNDVASGVLQLETALVGTYSIGGGDTVTVTLMKEGAAVEVAQVQVKGVGWDVYQVDHNLVRIYLPAVFYRDRLLDASFIHAEVDTGAPTTAVLTGGTAGDLTITGDGTGTPEDFPRAGTMIIDSGGANEEIISFTRQLWSSSAALYASDTVPAISGIPSGSTTLFVDDVTALAAFDAVNTAKQLTIAVGTGSEEVVVYTEINSENNTITLAAPGTAGAQVAGASIHPMNPDVFVLGTPLKINHAGGETIGLYQPVAPSSTNLVDGRTFTSDLLFQGPYLFSRGDRSVRSTAGTTLAENVSGPLLLEVSQRPPGTCLEVRGGRLLTTAGAFDIQVGFGTGSVETVDVVTVVIQRDVSGVTINANDSAGVSVLTLSSTADVPDANGYRLLIDEGGSNEEVVIVQEINVPVANQITLQAVTTEAHSIGETVRLMADVAVLSSSVGEVHTGRVPYTQRTMRWPTSLTPRSRINTVSEVRTHLTVTSAANFSAIGGYAYLNFGSVAAPVSSQLSSVASAAAGSIVLASSDLFPASGYPYVIKIEPGSYNEEIVLVTGNNTGTDTLTITETILFDHPKGSVVEYLPGVEIVEYSGTTTGGPERLLFSSGLVLKNAHLNSESIKLADYYSIPASDGSSHPLHFPQDWEERLRFLIDSGRAAGVQIIITNDK